MKTKVINLFGGPGTGKSTTAAALFAELKHRDVNCEYIQEYAKDKAWEFGDNHIGTPLVFRAQEYIFGKQHLRMRRCAQSVDIIITDSPLLFSIVYLPQPVELQSLTSVVREAHDLYDNFNVLLRRTKKYNPKGRFQSQSQAEELDTKVRDMLDDQKLSYHILDTGRGTANGILAAINAHSYWKL